MNTYNVVLKHDKGTFTVSIKATDKNAAIRMVIASENCPPQAVLKAYDRLFNTKDGHLTSYAFACGYLDLYDGAFPVYIERDSACWHVKRSYFAPDWSSKPALWECFDTLPEARKFARRYVKTGINTNID